MKQNIKNNGAQWKRTGKSQGLNSDGVSVPALLLLAASPGRLGTVSSAKNGNANKGPWLSGWRKRLSSGKVFSSVAGTW